MRIPKSLHELPPEGTTPARVKAVIDVGTQTVNHETGKRQHRVSIHYQMVDELDSSGVPFVAWREYGLTLHEKGLLRPALIATGFTPTELDADDFDLFDALGRPLLITISHRESERGIFANVTGETALLKGMVVAPLVGEGVKLGLTESEFNPEVFEDLPEKLQEKIKRTAEYQALVYRHFA